MKQVTDQLNSVRNKSQDLRKKLAGKERLISEISSTHMSCRDIVSKYQKIQNQVDKNNNEIADLRNGVVEKGNVITNLRWWRGVRGEWLDEGSRHSHTHIHTLALTLTPYMSHAGKKC